MTSDTENAHISEDQLQLLRSQITHAREVIDAAARRRPRHEIGFHQEPPMEKVEEAMTCLEQASHAGQKVLESLWAGVIVMREHAKESQNRREEVSAICWSQRVIRIHIQRCGLKTLSRTNVLEMQQLCVKAGMIDLFHEFLLEIVGRELSPDDQPAAAEVRIIVAEGLMRQKCQFDLAAQLCTAARRILESSRGAMHPMIGQASLRLAQALANLKRYSEAISEARLAAGILLSGRGKYWSEAVLLLEQLAVVTDTRLPADNA